MLPAGRHSWFHRPRYLVPLIVACALFMENMDATVIATALPTIARSFGESPLQLNLAITAYLLELGIFLPLSGWLADRFGARSVFCSAIVIFTLGSIGCSAVQTLPQLVLARIVQGMGGAMMVPVGRLVVLRTIPKSELLAAMAHLTVPALIGPVIEPPLDGFIVTYASWRWIFLINIPIGVLGLSLAAAFVPNMREPREERDDRVHARRLEEQGARACVGRPACRLAGLERARLVVGPHDARGDRLERLPLGEHKHFELRSRQGPISSIPSIRVETRGRGPVAGPLPEGHLRAALDRPAGPRAREEEGKGNQRDAGGMAVPHRKPPFSDSGSNAATLAAASPRAGAGSFGSPAAAKGLTWPPLRDVS